MAPLRSVSGVRSKPSRPRRKKCSRSVWRCALASALCLAIVGGAPGSSTATFAGGDGRISYATYAGGDLEIHSANPDGTDVQRLTRFPANNQGAVISDWSPDGQMIAFDGDATDIDGRKGVMQVYVMTADGSDVTQLTRGPGFHGFPAWSPDATELAIDTDWGERPLTGIWIIPAVDPDGVTVEEARRLTDPPKGVDFDSEPQYSPDGTSIVFTRFKSAAKSAIHRINEDGSGLERLTSYKLNASDPDWSPDGTEIVFDSADGSRVGSKADIYVMRADGSHEQRLTKSPRLIDDFESPFELANNPVWSPSGSKIMFTRFTPEATQLVAMNRDGSGRRVVISRRKLVNKVDWGTHP